MDEVLLKRRRLSVFVFWLLIVALAMICSLVVIFAAEQGYYMASQKLGMTIEQFRALSKEAGSGYGLFLACLGGAAAILGGLIAFMIRRSFLALEAKYGLALVKGNEKVSALLLFLNTFLSLANHQERSKSGLDQYTSCINGVLKSFEFAESFNDISSSTIQLGNKVRLLMEHVLREKIMPLIRLETATKGEPKLDPGARVRMLEGQFELTRAAEKLAEKFASVFSAEIRMIKLGVEIRLLKLKEEGYRKGPNTVPAA
jgi:hypothetical protein